MIDAPRLALATVAEPSCEFCGAWDRPNKLMIENAGKCICQDCVLTCVRLLVERPQSHIKK